MTSYLDQMKKYFSTHNRVKDYQAHSSKVHSVNWSCDGRKLASGSFDKTVSVFALDRDRLVILQLSLNDIWLVFLFPHQCVYSSGKIETTSITKLDEFHLYLCFTLYQLPN